MQADFRDHEYFAEAEALASAWLRPGSGEPATLAQIAAHPDGLTAVAAAVICDELEGVPSTRIARIDLSSGAIDVLTHGPRSDHSPAWSPDGQSVAFLSDREQAHVSRLRILDMESLIDRPTCAVDGFVEALQWSADGRSILLCVAEFGSDLAGAQGAFTVERNGARDALPPWSPAIEGVADATPWRSLWLYDPAADTARRITCDGLNIWQACWCGPGHIAAICSDQPEETHWYGADVRLIDAATGAARSLFTPDDQLWHIAASPSGSTVAVVEAVCSDRMIAAGNLRLIDTISGRIDRPDTLGADVVQLHWRGEERLLFAGVAGADSLIGLLDKTAGAPRQLWRDTARTPSGPVFPEIAPLGSVADAALFLCESFFEAPSLLALEEGQERVVCRFGTPGSDARTSNLGTAHSISWTAPDGLTIEGWLLTPSSPGPHPVILQIHGGPVWHSRPNYVGRSTIMQMALGRGYALFQPNPRGSSGRGQAFARHVFGDMGGADTLDYLSGLDALEERGLIDPARIGVTGGSYGGYMTSWLITQDQRFAAAVPIAPVTNWVSMHLTCHVPNFCELFLADDIDNPTGKYHSRSPVHFVDRVTTPTLTICGALDRITPPGQAMEFHHALRTAGVESLLVTYPNEGHGVRTMPASFDFAARAIAWFDRYMPAEPRPDTKAA
ncbi:Dipeptidyl aminopeptidase/acylaminoacyl peptidase [Sphingopyxis sp. YR583]|uniref:alpha/beta hydrolase family protein n=1 Tax=Sphingopyxis sp. YR583 TaxID=1881047 RepID=UPI0008A7C9CD|nr:S9 family peptidase [Sphingopyxis sp. YR583]SEH13931.1 Dipeptidyl aminopeptidase/acylaminoacyl peptidase [Sphingopyxis sp. YR583]